MTTTNTLITWPALVSESGLTVHTTKSRRSKSGLISSKPGLIKRLDSPAEPDAATIKKLNELAAKRPFCTLHKVKKHETF